MIKPNNSTQTSRDNLSIICDMKWNESIFFWYPQLSAFCRWIFDDPFTSHYNVRLILLPVILSQKKVIEHFTNIKKPFEKCHIFSICIGTCRPIFENGHLLRCNMTFSFFKANKVVYSKISSSESGDQKTVLIICNRI